MLKIGNFLNSKGFIKASQLMSLLVVFLFFLFLINPASAAVDLTGTVNNDAPVVGDVEICETSCASYKALDPATAFTIKVTATDPNGAADIDWDSVKLEVYVTADGNDSSGADWDHVVLSVGGGLTQTDSGNGCTAGGDVNCFDVSAGSWSVKFLKGGADVWVEVADNTGVIDTNELVYAASNLGILVGGTTGISQDNTSGSFAAGSPGSTNNAFTGTQSAAAFVVTTHNGNQNLDVSVTATELASGANTISVDNLHWDLDGSPAGTDFTGGADAVQSTWGRGTDPTSGTFSLYSWLDIPAAQLPGSYTGTYTFGSAAS